VTYSQSSLDDAREQLKRDGARKGELQQRLDQLASDKTEHHDNAASLREQAQSAKQRLEQAQADYQQLQQRLNTRRRELDQAKSEVVSIL
ncbi:hypothetical protein R0K19_23860, partial [Bacillus sp. SIMBA_161]